MERVKMTASYMYTDNKIIKSSVLYWRTDMKKVQTRGCRLFKPRPLLQVELIAFKHFANVLTVRCKKNETWVCSRVGGGNIKKQHNEIKNKIKIIRAHNSSLELRTISSFTTFIVEGKISCTGVESTNTTSGSYTNLME